jgi:hypothetical protein
MQSSNESENHPAPVAVARTEPRATLESAREWLTTEVTFRLARGWLVAAAAVALLLVLIAVD